VSTIMYICKTLSKDIIATILGSYNAIKLYILRILYSYQANGSIIIQ